MLDRNDNDSTYQLRQILTGMPYDDFVAAVKANFAILLNAYIQGSNVVNFSGNPGTPGADGERGPGLFRIYDSDLMAAKNLPAVQALLHVDIADPLANAETTVMIVNAIFAAGANAIARLFGQNVVINTENDLVMYDTMMFSNGTFITITWTTNSLTAQRSYTLIDTSITQSQYSIDYEYIINNVLNQIILPSGQSLVAQPGGVLTFADSYDMRNDAIFPESVIPDPLVKGFIYVSISCAGDRNMNSVLVAGTEEQLRIIYQELMVALRESSHSLQIDTAKETMPREIREPAMFVIQSMKTGSPAESENEMPEKQWLLPKENYGIVLADMDSLPVDEEGELMKLGAQFGSFASLSKSVNGVWLCSNCDLRDELGKIYLSRLRYQIHVSGFARIQYGRLMQEIDDIATYVYDGMVNTIYFSNANTVCHGDDLHISNSQHIERFNGEFIKSHTINNQTITKHVYRRTAELGYNGLMYEELAPGLYKVEQYDYHDMIGLNELHISDAKNARGKYPRCRESDGYIEWITGEQMYKEISSGGGGGDTPGGSSVVVPVPSSIAEYDTINNIYNALYAQANKIIFARPIAKAEHSNVQTYVAQLDQPILDGVNSFQLIAETQCKRITEVLVDSERYDKDLNVPVSDSHIKFTILASNGQYRTFDMTEVFGGILSGDNIVSNDNVNIADFIDGNVHGPIICKQLALIPKRANESLDYYDILAVFSSAEYGMYDTIYGYQGYDLDNAGMWRPTPEVVLTMRLNIRTALSFLDPNALCYYQVGDRFMISAKTMGLGNYYVPILSYFSGNNYGLKLAYYFADIDPKATPNDNMIYAAVYDSLVDSPTSFDSRPRNIVVGTRIQAVRAGQSNPVTCCVAICKDLTQTLANTEVNRNEFDLYNEIPYNSNRLPAAGTTFSNPLMFIHGARCGLLAYIALGNDKIVASMRLDTNGSVQPNYTNMYEVTYHTELEMMANDAANDPMISPLFDNNASAAQKHQIFASMKRITESEYNKFRGILQSGNKLYIVNFGILYEDNTLHATVIFDSCKLLNFGNLYAAAVHSGEPHYTVMRGVMAFPYIPSSGNIYIQDVNWTYQSGGNPELYMTSFTQFDILNIGVAEQHMQTTIHAIGTITPTTNIGDVQILPIMLPNLIACVTIRPGETPQIIVQGSTYAGNVGISLEYERTEA